MLVHLQQDIDQWRGRVQTTKANLAELENRKLVMQGAISELGSLDLTPSDEDEKGNPENEERGDFI